MAEMDEHDPRPDETPGDPHAENLARHGAPVPPPASPSQPPAPASLMRRRVPRLLAAGTALTVVPGAAGVGFAIGRLAHHAQSSAGGPPAGYAGQPPNGQV